MKIAALFACLLVACATSAALRAQRMQIPDPATAYSGSSGAQHMPKD